MNPARLNAISVAAAAPEDWVINVASQPSPNAFTELTLSLVRERNLPPKEAEETLISVNENMKKYNAAKKPITFNNLFFIID